MKDVDHNLETEPRLGARTLVMLSLAALAVRVLYWQEHARSAFFAIPLLDQRYYDRFARTLVAGGDLSEYGGFRPVLYPFWLSLVYRLGDTMGLPAALFLQHLMGVGTVAMVAVMGARLFRSRAAGVCAGVLYMLAAPPLYFEGELLIASFLTCLLTIVCCGVVTMGRSPSLLRGLWLGGVAGMAAQARPNAIILWLAFAVLTAVAWRCKERARARAGAVALATALVVQALFGFVNAAQSGHYQFITAAGGINFYLGNSRQADGMIPRQERSVTYHGAYRDSIRLFAEQEYHAAMTAQNQPPSNHPAAISHYWRQRGIAEIAAAPGRWVGLMAKKSWLLLWNHEVANNKSFTFIQREESPLLRILPVRWWLLLSLAPAGLWLAWRRQPRNAGPVLFLLSVLLAYAATLALFFVNGRFRAPLWPLMAVWAGGGLVALRTHQHRAWLCGAAGVLLLVLSLGNLFRVPEDDVSRDYFFRAKANLLRGQLEQAATDVHQCLTLDPTNLDARFLAGNVCFAQGDFAQAESHFEDLSRRDPLEPRVWNNLGAARERQARGTEAYRAYTQALALDPASQHALINMALLEIRAGQFEPAANKLARLSPAAAGRPDALCAQAFIAAAHQDDAAATRLLLQARTLSAEVCDALLAERAHAVTLPVPR